MSKNLKNIGIVSALTGVSRVLGLIRDQLGAAIFGASLLNSAFLTAFRLPNLFRRILGEGSLTAAFLPTLQEELHRGGRAAADALVNKVVSWLLVVTGVLSVLAVAVLGHSRLLHGREERWYLVTDLSAILFPYLALICLAAALNATLNVLERFTEPALSPIWLNLSMIVSLGGAGLGLAHSPMGEIHWLCAGVLAGGALQLAVPAVVLVREGWRPRFDLGLSPPLRRIAALMAPGFFGAAIYQVNIYVSSLLAYRLNDFAATLMFYANRLMELPIGVFAIAVSTVVYPLIARHAVQRDFAAMAGDYLKGLRLILLINLPAAAGLGILCGPIVRLLFAHGKFTGEDARLMAPLLAIFVVGLPFFSIVNLTIRAFYSLRDTATPVKVAAVDFAINLTLSLLLMGRFGVRGLVLASTAAIIAQTILLQAALAKKLPEMSFKPLWPCVWKTVAATLVMATVVAGAARVVPTAADAGLWANLIGVLALIFLGALVYGVAAWRLRIEGLEEVEAVLKRIFSAGRGLR